MIVMTQGALQRLGDPRIARRLFGLAAMLGVLVAFRHLALLFVAFLVFARSFGWLGQAAAPVVGGSQRRGVLLALFGFLAIIGLGVAFSVRAGSQFYLQLVQGDPIPERIAALQADVLGRMPAWVPLEGIKERAPHMLEPVFTYVRTTGQVLLNVLIGLILAIVYLLDRDEVDRFIAQPEEESLLGCARRYFCFLSEAVLITIQLQLIVALVNTALTLLVLIALRLPHLFSFSALIFGCSLVPVVGNLISGAVLIVASFAYRGIFGVVAFVILTFVLHKIEAYYINPRLTSRHVHLPALVLIISLIGFEHVFGLVGLFLSFPSLYVGIKISQDFQAAAAARLAEKADKPTLPAAPTAALAAAPVDPSAPER